MEVEMVLAQVGEDCDCEPHTVDAVECERVTRDLHRSRRDPALDHGREQRLEIRGLRCRADAGHDVRANSRLNGADETGHVACVPQARFDEVRRRGLAVRARHPDEDDPVRRVVVDPAGDRP